MEANGAFPASQPSGSRLDAMDGSRDIMENRAGGSISIADSDGRFFPCDGIAPRRSPALNGLMDRRSRLKAKG
jgi:hypothetical protein